MIKYFFSFIIIASSISCISQKIVSTTTDPTLILHEDFNGNLDTNLWVAEIAPQPNSTVYTRNGQLILDTKGGVTVWLNKKLKGNLQIEFTRKVLIDTGKNDRLSDLNFFWMATDLRNKNLFTRNGVLESYDSLQLYYVGMGGNTNSTTRFRKYEGNGERTLLKEYPYARHLLEANKEYKIIIAVKGNTTTVSVNGEEFFTYTDPSILKEGYFGFRSTKSRQAIDYIKVHQL